MSPLPPPSHPRLEVRGVFAAWHYHSHGVVDGYDDGRPVSVALESGQWLGIVGRNGVGKSTLLHAIAGTAPFVAGEVRVDGVVQPARRPGTRFTASVASVPQHSEFLQAVGEGMTLQDAVDLVMAERPGLFNEKALPDLWRRLMECKWLSSLDSNIGGRMFDVVCAIMAVPRVLLLDEVLGAWPLAMRLGDRYAEIRALLPRTAVVFADHDIRRMVQHADRLLLLQANEHPVIVDVKATGKSVPDSRLLKTVLAEYSHDGSEALVGGPSLSSSLLIREDRLARCEVEHALRAAAIRSESLSSKLEELACSLPFQDGRKLVRHLSGGQRVVLASMLAEAVGCAIDPDELMHLDSVNRQAVDRIRALSRSGNYAPTP